MITIRYFSEDPGKKYKECIKLNIKAMDQTLKNSNLSVLPLKLKNPTAGSQSASPGVLPSGQMLFSLLKNFLMCHRCNRSAAIDEMEKLPVILLTPSNKQNGFEGMFCDTGNEKNFHSLCLHLDRSIRIYKYSF
jgi:hypothetical protein